MKNVENIGWAEMYSMTLKLPDKTRKQINDKIKMILVVRNKIKKSFRELQLQQDILADRFNSLLEKYADIILKEKND